MPSKYCPSGPLLQHLTPSQNAGVPTTFDPVHYLQQILACCLCALPALQDVADSCRTGPATDIIFGLALGYRSCIIPCFVIAVAIYVSNSLAGMLGIACAALGMLATLSTGLAIDAYGPISDNAGGIAEMAGMGKLRWVAVADMSWALFHGRVCNVASHQIRTLQQKVYRACRVITLRAGSVSVRCCDLLLVAPV